MPISTKQLLLYVLLISSLCLTATPALSKVIVHMEPATDSTERRVKAKLEKSKIVNTITDFLNDTIKTRYTITVVMGGDIGPVYIDRAIHIPYYFLGNVKSILLDARYYHHRDNIDVVINDILTHTILHEIAHALIEQYELPVLGKEEDAADAFANFMLLHHFDDGPHILRSVADAFRIQSKRTSRYRAEDYASEHSLDIQRYYMIMCHIYGSNPQRNSEFKRRAKLSNDRAESCEIEFEEMAYSWVRLLKPYLK